MTWWAIVLTVSVMVGPPLVVIVWAAPSEVRDARQFRRRHTLDSIERLEYELGYQDPEPGYLPPGRDHIIRK